MSCLLALVLPVFAICCRTRFAQNQGSLKQSADASANTSRLTACMAIQGNGANFSSHLGTLIALFEKNIEPTIIIGGSSGSIVGSIGRALMNNSSIQKAQVWYMGRELGMPQKAALILAAAEEVMNGFLFVPGFDEFGSGDQVRYMMRFLFNFLLGNRQLPSQADSKILNIEPTVGTAVLVAAFFELSDFSKILQATHAAFQDFAAQAKKVDSEYGQHSPLLLQEFKTRKEAVTRAFHDYAGMGGHPELSNWTLAKVIDVFSDANVFPSRKNPLGNPEKLVQLKLLKLLFREDFEFHTDENTQEVDLKNHQNMLRAIVLFGGLWSLVNNGVSFYSDSLERARAIAAEAIPGANSQFLNSTDKMLNGRFFVADPELIWRAYEGYVKDPVTGNERFFEVPKGMIVHSTFRVGKMVSKSYYKTDWWSELKPDMLDPRKIRIKKEAYAFEEIAGSKYLYQGYIAGGSEFAKLKERRDAAWQDWISQGKTWSKKRTAERIVSLAQFERLPYLVYDVEDLVNSDRLYRLLESERTGKLAREARILPVNKNAQAGTLETYLPPDQIILFDQAESANIGSRSNRGLNFAIRSSAAEPGAFRRYGIRWTPHDVSNNVLLAAGAREKAIDYIIDEDQLPESKDGMKVVAFGGWSENVPLSAVAHFPECQKADFFVMSGMDQPGNDFQWGALLAAVNGNFDLKNKASQDEIKETEGLFQRVNAAALFSKSFSDKPYIKNDMNFDKPCELFDGEKGCSLKDIEKINNALVPFPWGVSRLPLAVVGYQKTLQSIENLKQAQLTLANKDLRDSFDREFSGERLNAFGQPIAGRGFLVVEKPDAEEIAEFMRRVSEAQSLEGFKFSEVLKR